MDIQHVIDFDYHPSFSTMLIDHWRRFDANAIKKELICHKCALQNANAVRITHSYDAYLRNPSLYLNRFEQVLSICDSLGLGVISCLFNGWHDINMDCGGIYLEYLIPGFGWSWKEGFYGDFLTALCAKYAHDLRVILWETCNKPYGCFDHFINDDIHNHLYEKRWLREIYCFMKKAEVIQPIGISVREWFPTDLMDEIAYSSDIMLISPYYCNAEKSKRIMAHPFDRERYPMLVIHDIDC